MLVVFGMVGHGTSPFCQGSPIEMFYRWQIRWAGWVSFVFHPVCTELKLDHHNFRNLIFHLRAPVTTIVLTIIRLFHQLVLCFWLCSSCARQGLYSLSSCLKPLMKVLQAHKVSLEDPLSSLRDGFSCLMWILYAMHVQTTDPVSLNLDSGLVSFFNEWLR